MAEQATRRQRSDEMTQQGRTEGQITRREGQGMERSRSGRDFPSVFSVSPGEFFTMSPVRLMRRLTEDLDRAFFGTTGMNREFEQDLTWVPSVEVRQSGNNLIVYADLPGLNENDIKVEATEDGLILQGERRREEEREEGGWYRSERVYGHFYRFIPLPEGAKLDQAQANFKNGVLEITIPVPESAQTRRQIPISTTGASSQSVLGTGESRSRAATSASNR
jgi:HSP20 family protein